MENIKTLKKIFSKIPAIKLAYFFGSRAVGDAGVLSDYDFAIYLEEPDQLKRFDIKLELMAQLSQVLGTGKIDIVILNDVYKPELKFHIIKDGQLFLEREPYKILVEPGIMSEYFDFREGLRRYGLTKA